MPRPLGLAHLSHKDLDIRLRFHCLKFLDEVLQFLLDGKVEATWVEGVDVNVVKPD